MKDALIYRNKNKLKLQWREYKSKDKKIKSKVNIPFNHKL